MSLSRSSMVFDCCSIVAIREQMSLAVLSVADVRGNSVDGVFARLPPVSGILPSEYEGPDLGVNVVLYTRVDAKTRLRGCFFPTLIVIVVNETPVGPGNETRLGVASVSAVAILWWASHRIKYPTRRRWLLWRSITTARTLRYFASFFSFIPFLSESERQIAQ
jgi:hypothetical protein